MTPTHPTHASFLDDASDFISGIEDVDFEASWMLVVRWIDACPFGNGECTQASIVYLRVNIITIILDLYRKTTTRLSYSLMVHNPILCSHTSVVNSTGLEMLLP